MDILTVLILPIHDHKISFLLFVSSSISFISVLQFAMYRPFTYLVKFIPKYFILFDAIVNWIVFLISLSDSLLVYRSSTDFCILIFFFFKEIHVLLFIYLWLCWVFVSVRGLSPVAASGDHSSSRCMGLSLSRPLLLWSTGSRRAGSVIVAHGPSRSVACGIFPDRGTNPCPLHWQADSEPLRHQGSPVYWFCTLQLYWNFSLVLTVFWWSLLYVIPHTVPWSFSYRVLRFSFVFDLFVSILRTMESHLGVLKVNRNGDGRIFSCLYFERDYWMLMKNKLEEITVDDKRQVELSGKLH